MRSRRIGAGEKELESRDEELERRSKRKGAELSLTLTSGLKGSFEWGPNKSYNITSMSFELQEWFSSQNWSDFCQEFISELQFAPAGSHQLRAALVRSRQLGALRVAPGPRGGHPRPHLRRQVQDDKCLRDPGLASQEHHRDSGEL